MLNLAGMLPVSLEWYAAMAPKGQRKGRMDFATWVTAPTKPEAMEAAYKEAEANGFFNYRIVKISEVR